MGSIISPQQQMQQQTEQTKQPPEPVELPRFDLYMEVEAMPPPQSSSLKREREEEESEKVLKKKKRVGEVGWRRLWVKLSLSPSLFCQQEQKKIRAYPHIPY